MPWVLFQHLNHIVPLKISLQTIDNHQIWPASPLPTGTASATHKTRILCIFTVKTLCTMTDSFHQLHPTLSWQFLYIWHSPQHALFLIYMLLHAILCFIITAQHDAKWPWNSVWMRMLSPVSLRWYNVTKHHCFPLFSIFIIFKGGVALLLMLWWLCVGNWKQFMWV